VGILEQAVCVVEAVLKVVIEQSLGLTKIAMSSEATELLQLLLDVDCYVQGGVHGDILRFSGLADGIEQRKRRAALFSSDRAPAARTNVWTKVRVEMLAKGCLASKGRCWIAGRVVVGEWSPRPDVGEVVRTVSFSVSNSVTPQWQGVGAHRSHGEKEGQAVRPI